MKLPILMTASILLFAGCVSVPPTEQEIAAVGGYGAPLTIDWQGVVKAYFLNKLKDPLSAQYIFYKPFAGAVRDTYYTFIFRNNQFLKVVVQDSEMTYGPQELRQ